jgi:hypothetical protein
MTIFKIGGFLSMSHHHHRHRNETGEYTNPESMSKSMFPLFEKNDLAFLSLIKPLLSPNGQKIVDLVLIFNGGPAPENQPDLMGLLSQLNMPGDNNNAKELLMNLLNSMNNLNPENKSNPNLAMLASLANSLSPKNKTEDL